MTEYRSRDLRFATEDPDRVGDATVYDKVFHESSSVHKIIARRDPRERRAAPAQHFGA